MTKAIIESFERKSSSLFVIWGVFIEDEMKTSFYIESSAQSLEELTAKLRSEFEISKKQLVLDLKPGTEIDLTPPIINPPEPDPEATARQEFLTALDKWRSARRIIEDGIIKSDDTNALALLDDVIKKYKPEYIILG